MGRLTKLTALLASVMCLAFTAPAFCMGLEPIESAQYGPDDSGIVWTLNIYEAEPGCIMQLTLVNFSEQDISLSFLSGEQFDFRVMHEGLPLWSYNFNRFFVMTESELLLPAQSSVSRSTVWDGFSSSGEFLSDLSLRELEYRALCFTSAGTVTLSTEVEPYVAELSPFAQESLTENYPLSPQPGGPTGHVSNHEQVEPAVNDELPYSFLDSGQVRYSPNWLEFYSQPEEVAVPAMLLDHDVLLYPVKSQLLADDAYVPAGRWCYAAFLALAEAGEFPGHSATEFDGSSLLSGAELRALTDEVEAQLAGEPGDRLRLLLLTSLRAELYFEPAAGASVSSYADVPTGHWAYGACHFFIVNGLLEGYPEGFFLGERVLTRYEFAQTVARARDAAEQKAYAANEPGWSSFELLLLAQLEAEFADNLSYLNSMSGSCMRNPVTELRESVPQDHWAYNALNYLQEKGWLVDATADFSDRTVAHSRFEFSQAIAALLNEIDRRRSSGEPADEQIEILVNTLRAEFSEQIQ